MSNLTRVRVDVLVEQGGGGALADAGEAPPVFVLALKSIALVWLVIWFVASELVLLTLAGVLYGVGAGAGLISGPLMAGGRAAMRASRFSGGE